MSLFKKALIGGLLTGLFGLILIPLTYELEENLGLDILFKLRGERVPPGDVVVVTLDKDSATNLDLPPEPYKWPRSLHAQLLDNLNQKGAAVIAFDLIFKEPGPVDIDNRFAESIRKAGNVVLCTQLEKDSIPLDGTEGPHKSSLEFETLVPLIPSFAESAIASAPFPLPKIPVKVSQYWTFKSGAGDIPTFPAVVFQVFALDVYDDFIKLLKKADPELAGAFPQNRDEVITAKGVERLVQALRGIFVQDPALPERMLEDLDDVMTSAADKKKHQVLKSLITMYMGGNSHYLDFYGPPGTIYTIPYHHLIHHPGWTPVEYNAVDLKGKAVIVGLSERMRPEEKDGFYTAYSQSSGVDISGVEIAATAFANLMENAHVQPLSLPAHLFVVIFGGLILGIVCRIFPSVVAAACVMGMGTLYLAYADYQFKTAGIWSPLVLPLFIQAPVVFFGTVLWKYVETHRERQNVRKALGYYVPGGVADKMAKHMEDIRASKQVFRGTLLCTDAENYTPLSETLEPEALARVMNDYFETVFEPVKRNNGIISEVVADTMIAVWEANEPETDHRAQACHAALGIVDAVNGFNRANREFRLPTRMGLHTGQMMVGNIGAMDRYEYNPIGDIVNTASRIEGLNKHLGTRILASREVVDGLNDFLTRNLGEFILAGKSKPVAVYELICRREEAGEEQYKLCSIFPEVLDAYRNQSWENGIKMLSELLKMNGGDGPSRFYLAFGKQHAENPFAELWDGMVRVGKK